MVTNTAPAGPAQTAHARSVAAFFSDDARHRTRKVIEAVESRTSAEVVVLARRASGRYRDIAYIVGAVVAEAALAALVFLPDPFDEEYFPFEVAVAFGVGALVGAHWPALIRLLAGNKRLVDETARAARVAFHDQRIHRTTGRTGLLVYFSALERRVAFVADIGIDTRPLGEPYEALVARAGSAARAADLDAFLAALAELGPVLGAAHPRAQDDVNELPDEMVVS